MRAKFRVGDRVRIMKNDDGRTFLGYDIEAVATIKAIHNSNDGYGVTLTVNGKEIPVRALFSEIRYLDKVQGE